MDIANIATQKTTFAVDARQSGLSLRVGQILTATVQAKLSNNLFDLVVNNQRIQARTDQALSTGQNLKLVVEKLDNPIVLRALTHEKFTGSRATAISTKYSYRVVKTQPAKTGFFTTTA